MFLLNVIPWWGRLLAVAALAGVVWTHGYVRGHRAGDAELMAFKTAVAGESAKQEAHTAVVIQNQKEITQNVAKTYSERLAALKSAVRVPVDPGGREIPLLSCAAPGTDGPAADPVPAVSAQAFNELAGLAAQTTLQLLAIQDWIRQQQQAFP